MHSHVSSYFLFIIYELHEADCKNYLSKSLFVVGEFGGNDYNAALFSRRSMAEV